MATDIAFTVGVLAMLGNRIPASLKVFVVAFAVIDDLGAIIVIAAVYTARVSVGYIAGAFAVWVVLALNRPLRVMSLFPYLMGGAVLWFRFGGMEVSDAKRLKGGEVQPADLLDDVPQKSEIVRSFHTKDSREAES